MQNNFEVTYTYHIPSRGFMVGGRIANGTFRVGDRVQISRNGSIFTTGLIAGIEFLNFGRNSDRTDNIVFLLNEFGDIGILPGDMLCTVMHHGYGTVERK